MTSVHVNGPWVTDPSALLVASGTDVASKTEAASLGATSASEAIIDEPSEVEELPSAPDKAASLATMPASKPGSVLLSSDVVSPSRPPSPADAVPASLPDVELLPPQEAAPARVASTASPSTLGRELTLVILYELVETTAQ